jgi:hypothetical protein
MFLASSLIVNVTCKVVLELVGSMIIPSVCQFAVLHFTTDNAKLIVVDKLSAEIQFLEPCGRGCMTMDSQMLQPFPYIQLLLRQPS